MSKNIVTEVRVWLLDNNRWGLNNVFDEYPTELAERLIKELMEYVDLWRSDDSVASES